MEAVRKSGGASKGKGLEAGSAGVRARAGGDGVRFLGMAKDTQATVRGEQRVSLGEGRDQIHVLKGPWLPWGCESWQSAGLLMQDPPPCPPSGILGVGAVPNMWVHQLGHLLGWGTLPSLQAVGNSKSLPWPSQGLPTFKAPCPAPGHHPEPGWPYPALLGLPVNL